MSKIIDMTGWIMAEHGVPDSRLTVLYEVEPHITSGGHKQRQYLCECSCINPKTNNHPQLIVKASSLRSGNTKSCGCIKRELLAQRNAIQGTQIQIGDKYGKLTVIQDLGLRKQASRDKNWRWSLCQCECGNIIEVPNSLLVNGHTKSCGCLQSQGEFVIEKLLKDHGIQYIKEYKFSDLIGKKYPYRFDFAIFKNDTLQFLIEFDGRQHYTGPEASWKNTRTLEEIQLADKAKNAYCIEHNYLLKRIPYYELDNLSYELILSNKFDITTSE